MKFYALKTKRRMEFTCISKTPEDLDHAITDSFYRWRGCQPKGNDLQVSDFLERFDKVAVTIEKIF